MQLAQFFNIADAEQLREQSGKRYLEFLRIPALSAGVYVLPAGGTDRNLRIKKTNCTTWFADARACEPVPKTMR